MASSPIALPVAVQVAIAIFFTKELLEAVRRWKANSRKVEAIKQLIAAECERNKFAIDSLRSDVQAATEADVAGDQILLSREASGETRLTIVEAGALEDDMQAMRHSSVVRRPSRTLIDKYLFDAASLDSGLFYAMEKMSHLLAEVDHVRTSLLQFIEKDRVYFGGFDEYACGELKKAEDANAALYFRCTLSVLKRGRVR